MLGCAGGALSVHAALGLVVICCFELSLYFGLGFMVFNCFLLLTYGFGCL